MSLKYYILAPLIVPKLKQGCNSPSMKNFLFTWNRNTGEQSVEYSDDNGTHSGNGSVSVSEIMEDGKGRRLIDLLDGLYTGWSDIYGLIDIENKKITLIFKNGTGQTIGIRQY